MTRNFSELRNAMPPESQARAHEKAKAMLGEMFLRDIRKARGLSQVSLADILEVQQPAIARAEGRSDMYISTLRNHIRALGGELELIACFPEGRVRIKNNPDS